MEIVGLLKKYHFLLIEKRGYLIDFWCFIGKYFKTSSFVNDCNTLLIREVPSYFMCWNNSVFVWPGLFCIQGFSFLFWNVALIFQEMYK